MSAVKMNAFWQVQKEMPSLDSQHLHSYNINFYQLMLKLWFVMFFSCQERNLLIRKTHKNTV